MSMQTPTQSDITLPLVQGPIWSTIWHASWPMVVNMCAFAFGGFVDTWVAGRRSAEAQAGLGIGWQIRYFMLMLAISLEVGTISLVSRYFGARDHTGATESARQSLVFAAIFGCVSATVGLLIARPLLHLLGASTGVEEEGWNYLKLTMISTIPITMLWTSQCILRAIGDTRMAMNTTLLVTGLITIC